MEHDYDFIIIGSGFGGSVSALRLSEKGYRVRVIEKGKWYRPEDFATSNWNLKKWLWIPVLRCFGIMKVSFFRHVNILSGVGVGGGSLVYANTLPVPKASFFHSGSWNGLADWETELQPYYERALRMLGAAKNPKFYDGDLAMKELAREIDREQHFGPTNVAVYFGRTDQQVPDPYFDGKGPQRTGCTFCGACMTGCRVGAKNSLDKNYLHLAQSLGTTILAESEVIDVRPLDNDRGETGYRVSFRSSTRLNKKRESLTAKGVIFSGGVLGTISLLLRLKQTSLPRLSDRVGKDIRTNNETLVSVTTLDKNQDHSRGVAIGSILHSDDNSHLEIVRYAKGSGFWRLSHLPHVSGANGLIRFFKMLGVLFRSPVRYFRLFTVRDWARSTSVLLFMQTLDSTLSFRKNGLGGLSTVARTSEKPMADIPESNDLIRRYARIVGGLPTALSVQVLAGTASTAHLLGGAVMGKNANEGVIGPDNRVYGYENLWVVDGAMISANPGVNPSLSITAIAERAMDQISPKGS